MTNHLESLEISPEAVRQYIDARAAFAGLGRSKKNALQFRGGMFCRQMRLSGVHFSLCAGGFPIY